VDAFLERLIVGAATIDELLSDGFEPRPEPAPPEGGDRLLARRLAAWRRSCAAGDETLFGRRLDRDRWSLALVEERFATVRRRAAAPPPAWLGDAVSIETALQSPAKDTGPTDAKSIDAKPRAQTGQTEPCAFEQLYLPVVEHAEALLWSGLGAKPLANLTMSARSRLSDLLLKALSELCVAAVYERFAKARNAAADPADAVQRTGNANTARYDRFVADMKAGGFRRLFEDKPVLLRLIACLTRQWIDTSREFVMRLECDLPAIRRELLGSPAESRVNTIEGELSDPHNNGRSVLTIGFEDGARVAYKPKDLRLDVAWHDLIAGFNRADPPVDLKAPRVIARNGYGWTEFIAHTGCTDVGGCERFFRRAGAWLALLHCFAATDMHQENVIAAGEHPVPIDLETILQPSAEEHRAKEPEGEAFDAAMEIVGNSVMTVGLLPAYGRSVDNNVFAMGGMTADWNLRTVIRWNGINSDAMRPAKAKEQSPITPNLPHVDGRYARFGDHSESFIAGFADYAEFLRRRTDVVTPAALFESFAGLPVRKIIRPTRFYYMLLQRLKDHRTMDDGAVWSAQADFVARLSEWDQEVDPLWPLHRAERAALLGLNVPYFVTPSDGNAISDTTGVSIHTAATAGLDRAVTRLQNFDAQEIAWQIAVIRENTKQIAPAVGPAAVAEGPARAEVSDPGTSTKKLFLAEADRIAAELSHYAIRRGPGAAWIGLDWLGDAEVFQLVCLGPDLYNGATGIALFLAAHAAVTVSAASGELALAGLSHLRKNLKSRNAARMARSLGVGGAVGLGSIVYALAVIAKGLRNDELLADAHGAARLFTDELIAADKQLDVMGGSAGAILALLRLYRDTQSGEVLARAIKCGEHLLRQPRIGTEGRRSWVGQGSGARGLNGMSHGAAGFAYALAMLAAATGREEFGTVAAECLAFENASYDAARHNWPDLRGGGEPQWPCQWCHGAPGIGLARLAMTKRGATNAELQDRNALTRDIGNALEGVESGSPTPVDTLCCGTLGGVEFFCEAATVLHRGDLRELAAGRLRAVLERADAAGDYRWNSGKRQFNLGLFRGLSGVGYTLLRQAADANLPNVIIWE
jgi:type 2 lantibiotic biosynthesis protein LanM